jgi:hypothetical protein
MAELPTVGALLEGSPPAQRLALSAFHLFASASDRLAYESSAVLPSGLKAAIARYANQEAVVLPLFHGYPVPSETLSELLDLAAGRRAFLALCASDSSVILYEISDFEFPPEQ